MDKTEKKNEIMPYLSFRIRSMLELLSDEKWDKLTEIRITVNSPVILGFEYGRMYLGFNGLTTQIQDLYKVTPEDMNMIIELITKSSVYSYERHINSGFLTMPGGNRIGIVGNCVFNNGKIMCVNDISSVNIRIAHERIGVSDVIFDDVYKNNVIMNTLIVSPPGCGKTTMLRDIARSFSNLNKTGRIITGAVVDERYELACICKYSRSLDIGINNFVISGCPKCVAIPLVTRSMSPDVIIVDEMCDAEDFKAAAYAKLSGCCILASVHGKNEKHNELLGTDYMRLFDVVVVLGNSNGPGTVEKILCGE